MLVTGYLTPRHKGTHKKQKTALALEFSSSQTSLTISGDSLYKRKEDDNEPLQAASLVYLGNSLYQMEFHTLRGDSWYLPGRFSQGVCLVPDSWLRTARCQASSEVLQGLGSYWRCSCSRYHRTTSSLALLGEFGSGRAWDVGTGGKFGTEIDGIGFDGVGQGATD